MIVPMKHLTLLCVEKEREQTLEKLRELGCVHLELKNSESERYRKTMGDCDALRQAVAVIQHAMEGKTAPAPAQSKTVSTEELSAVALQAEPNVTSLQNGSLRERATAVLSIFSEIQTLSAQQIALREKQIRYAKFGSLSDLSLPQELAAKGLTVRLFSMPLDATPPAGDPFIAFLGEDERNRYGVQIGGESLPENSVAIPLPERPTAEFQTLAELAKARQEKLQALLKQQTALREALQKELIVQEDQVSFVLAADTMEEQGAVSWISGWVPEPRLSALREAAKENAWGTLLRAPEADENPPTLLQPPKLFRPVLTLFHALGIAPAYSEADVSVPFFAFFSIFFAMLVGDGGYGALILALTLWARKKMPKAPKAPFTLMTVFSLATIAWGYLSNTWFGVSPACLANPVAEWLGDPTYKNMMLLCFTLGVAHLMIARIWNAICLFPDSKALAQLGWAGIVAFMYCMTCGVVGIFESPTFMYWVFGASLVLVFGFSLKKSELKEHGVELGMMPLTIAGTLGDIISYVRLFAVGLASVKVAQNFNDMAINLNLPLWLKIVPMLLILLIGHGLNFAMAGLSILVHAVRLNTLEFSNHKGISWAGYDYKPFKRKTAES